MSLFKFANKTPELPSSELALPDRPIGIDVNPIHYVSGHRIVVPIPNHMKKAVFGMGCFWGAERLFWTLPGVYSTAVGYSGGITANPSYEDVCSGQTGHSEVVLVFYDPVIVAFNELLKVFWESHNPTQGMRQGNDVGTQYRSAIYGADESQMHEAKESLITFQSVLAEGDYQGITTEINVLDNFYYAEDYHQQYLAKNPNGYCGISGIGKIFPCK